MTKSRFVGTVLVFIALAYSTTSLPAANQTFCGNIHDGWLKTGVAPGACGGGLPGQMATSALDRSVNTILNGICLSGPSLPFNWVEYGSHYHSSACESGPGTSGNNTVNAKKTSIGRPIINTSSGFPTGGTTTGVVNAINYSYNFGPGDIVAIFGGDLSTSCGATGGSTVRFVQGSTTITVTPSYQCLTQVNVTVPSTLQHAGAYVRVTNANGYNSFDYYIQLK